MSSPHREDGKSSSVQPQLRLELSLSPQDGSLVTAPLSTVINAATDSLYKDLHTMTYGELTIAVPTAAASESADNAEAKRSLVGAKGAFQTRTERMSSLSFAQRRHELASRIARHARSISHVSAIVASYLPQTASSFDSTSSTTRHRHVTDNLIEEGELNEIVSVASKSLKHIRESWVQADEAQDAMFFHHAELWKARRHSHDVLGAAEVIVSGTWSCLPTDIALQVDRYDISEQKSRGLDEVLERLRGAVRGKLALGEVAKRRNLPWKIVLEKGGGVIRVTHGTPRLPSTAEQLQASKFQTKKQKSFHTTKRIYPIEARLTVLSDEQQIEPIEWTLLSIHVNVSAKTGESNHQLELTKRQMFDLHRLCVRSMAVEEAQAARCNRQRSLIISDGNHTRMDTVVPRPLDCLFEVSHTFAISLQLEILSAQAEGLKRGAWGATRIIGSEHSGGATTAVGENEFGIDVSPVHFLDQSDRKVKTNKGKTTKRKVQISNLDAEEDDEEAKEEDHFDNDAKMNGGWDDTDNGIGSSSEDDEHRGETAREPLAVMAIHFWSVDDRYGSPKMGNLTSIYHSAPDTLENTSSTKIVNHLPSRLSLSDKRSLKRLTLEIRAVPRIGIEVALSGGDGVMAALLTTDKNDVTSAIGSKHLQRNVEKLLSFLQNPFQLSASDALLAATVICAERRCFAVVSAINRARDGDKVKKMLPPWLHLSVDSGSIAVSAEIFYYSKDNIHKNSVNGGTGMKRQQKRPPVLLFRLACDSRTGRFVTVFPRSATLLRSLACNDPNASDLHMLRHAASVQHTAAAAAKRRSAAAAGKELTGRAVREFFEGLNRSVDILGLRAGVGGEWHDLDAMSAALRERAVEQACGDVRVSLMTCAGIAAVYGVTAVAFGVLFGVDGVPDMAGGAIETANGTTFLPIPPLGIVMGQDFVEEITDAGDNEKKTILLIERELFAATCNVTDSTLTVFFFDVSTQVSSPTSLPVRTHCALHPLLEAEDLNCNDNEIANRTTKRARTTEGGNANNGGSSISTKSNQLLDEVQYLADRLNTTLLTNNNTAVNKE